MSLIRDYGKCYHCQRMLRASAQPQFRGILKAGKFDVKDLCIDCAEELMEQDGPPPTLVIPDSDTEEPGT